MKLKKCNRCNRTEDKVELIYTCGYICRDCNFIRQKKIRLGISETKPKRPHAIENDVKKLMESFTEYKYEPKDITIKPKQKLIQDGFYFKWSN